MGLLNGNIMLRREIVGSVIITIEELRNQQPVDNGNYEYIQFNIFKNHAKFPYKLQMK